MLVCRLNARVRDRVTDGAAVTVGNNCALACLTSARAERKLAKAAAMFWLETSICSSSALSSGSLNISHHLPRITSSIGCAVFQLFVPSSLKAPGVWTGGRVYFGAKLQPVSKAM